MANAENALREEIRLLKEKNASFELKLEEYNKIKLSCSDNLETMWTNLNTIRELILSTSSAPNKTATRPTISRSTSSSNFATTMALKSEIDQLKTQLAVYKNDFAEERVARLALQLENERLTSELQQLHQQNRALAVEAMNGQVELISRRNSRQFSEENDAAVTEDTTIGTDEFDGHHLDRKASCSHCNGIFGDIHSLETHIDECPAY